MAHFAELDANNVVLRVVVVNNDVLRENVTSEVDGMIQVTPIEKELNGVNFCKSLYGADTNWKQTSYNGTFRGKYAGIGDTFDGTNFVAPVVDTPAEEAVVLEAPVEVLTTDSIVAISESATASITLSPAGTADSITIETSNTGV